MYKYQEWTKEEIEHYIAKCKEHEERRASTNERNEYWLNYKTAARWEHG
jgi:hypothetical protein